MSYRPNCERCGHFVGDDGMAYTPYGNATMLEPPDEQYICARCWGAMAERDKELTRRIAWMGPQRLAAPSAAGDGGGE